LPINYKEPLDELAVKLDACHIWQSMQDQDFIALQNKVKNMRRDLDSLHTILANQPRLFLYKDLQKVVKALNKLATKNKPEIDELKSSLKKIQEQLQSDPHAADIAELRKLLQEINLNSVSTDDWGILQERCENVEEASETCLMVALGSILTLLCQRSRTYTKILYAGITRCLYPEIPQFENLPYDDVEDGRID
jgi:methionyl-tRNA synthetase